MLQKIMTGSSMPYPGNFLQLVRAAFSLLLLAVGMILAQPTIAAAQLKIGISLPLSGTAAPLAARFRIGAQLALADYNARSSIEAVAIIVDDGCDEEIARLAADDLKATGVSLVTGLICNASAKAHAGSFATTGVPVLVAGARSVRLIKDREREGWNLFRLSPGDENAALYAADIFGEAWQGKAYAIVDDGTVYGRNIADAFRTVMEERGLPPQFQDNFRPTQSTQARLVRRLRRAGITHVFVGASAEDVAMIARNADELGIDLEIVGGEVLSIMPYLPADQLPPDGLMAVAEKMAINPDLSEEFAARLADEGIEPEAAVLAGYQAIEVALQALTNRPDDPAGALTAMTFQTILGEVSFTEEGRNTTEQYALYRWQNGRFMPVNP